MDASGNYMDKYGITMRRIAEWASRGEPRVAFAEAGLAAPVRTPLRPYVELLFLVSGAAVLNVGRKTAHMKAGDAALINAHRGNSAEPLDGVLVYDCISFDIENARALGDLGRAPLLVVRRMEDAAGVHRLYREASFLFHAPPPHLPAIQFKAAVLRLLAALYAGGITGSAAGRTSGNRYVRRALETIRDRHADPALALGALARETGISADHLSRLFRAELGKSPKQYLADLRINRARSLLRQGSMSVKEVAHATGFRDPLYFSRLFRARVGLPPSEF